MGWGVYCIKVRTLLQWDSEAGGGGLFGYKVLNCFYVFIFLQAASSGTCVCKKGERVFLFISNLFPIKHCYFCQGYHGVDCGVPRPVWAVRANSERELSFEI